MEERKVKKIEIDGSIEGITHYLFEKSFDLVMEWMAFADLLQVPRKRFVAHMVRNLSKLAKNILREKDFNLDVISIDMEELEKQMEELGER